MLSSIGRAHWRSSCALAWRCPCPSPPAIHFRFRVLHPANPLLCQSPCSPCIHLHYAMSSVFGLAVTCTCQRQWQHQHQPGEPGGRGCGGQPSAHSWHFFSFTSLEMRLVSRLSWRAARLPGCSAARLLGCFAVGLPKCHVLLSNQINCRGWSCLPRWLASQRPLVSL